MKSALVVLAAAILLQAAVASAQCPNVGGSPLAQQYAANKIKLKYMSTGPGFNDDRPELYKSLVAATLPSTFDPTTTYSVHVRFLLNGSQSNVMWDVTIPPNGMWTQTITSLGSRWDFFDPTVTYGVRQARVLDFGSAYVVAWVR